MSNNINSTHQQDRVAQQKLVNARQQAGAQGQQQGAAFARMLSLACDEDTDLDVLQQSGRRMGLQVEATDTEASGNAQSSRKKDKEDKALKTARDPAAEGTIDGLHPAAQANATLMALLAKAQGDAPHGDSATLATGDRGLPDDGSPPAAGLQGTNALPTDAAADTGRPKSGAPGQAVREMARQLGAGLRSGAPGPDSASPAAPTGLAASQPGTSGAGSLTAQSSPPLAGGWEAAAAGADNPAAAGPAGVTAHGMSSVATARSGPAAEESGAADEGVGGAELTTEPQKQSGLRGAGSEGQAQAGLGGDAAGSTELGERSPQAEELGSSAEPWREQWAETMDQMGQQVSYWLSQGGVRQATLRVGSGWQQAMDVKLSMKNGQADIEFLTDHEAARNAIAEGGTEVLREMLAQSGIDLAQVSVGAQAQGGGSDAAPSRAGGDTSRRLAAGAEATEVPPTALQPRRAQSSGLDVYV